MGGSSPDSTEKSCIYIYTVSSLTWRVLIIRPLCWATLGPEERHKTHCGTCSHHRYFLVFCFQSEVQERWAIAARQAGEDWAESARWETEGSKRYPAHLAGGRFESFICFLFCLRSVNLSWILYKFSSTPKKKKFKKN